MEKCLDMHCNCRIECDKSNILVWDYLMSGGSGTFLGASDSSKYCLPATARPGPDQDKPFSLPVWLLLSWLDLANYKSGQQSSGFVIVLESWSLGVLDKTSFCQSYLFFLEIKFWLTFPCDALQYEITLNYYVKIAVTGSTNIYYSIPSLILTISIISETFPWN